MFWTFAEPAQFQDQRVVIGGETGHHLARALRVRPGEHGVVVSAGREFEVEISQVRGAVVEAKIIGQQPIRNEAGVDISLLQALLPNPDFDAVIEAGTAIGISRFVPILAARSVARPHADRLDRWQSITRSAAEQSHRGLLPTIAPPCSLGAALAREVRERRLVVLDPTASQALSRAIDGSDRYALAVGPEGGWTTDELHEMHNAGGVAVHLGPRILRARLAPIVAAAILVQQS